jgi:hypothetical protein
MSRWRTIGALAGLVALAGCATMQGSERTETVTTRTEGQAAPGGANADIVSTGQGYLVPAGYEFPIELSTELSTENSNVGDRVIGRLTQNLTYGGQVVVARGSQVQGTVVGVDDKDRGQEGRSYLDVDFDTLLLTDGTTYPMEADLSQYQARIESDTDDTLKGAAIGAGAGAIIGRVLGGGTGETILGAVIGGAAGAVIESQTTGEDVVVPAGTTLWLQLQEPVTVRRG